MVKIIEEGLYVNEACLDHTYHHKNLAQYMERAIYVCPYCGLSHFESHGDICRCETCGREVKYTEHMELCGVGFDFPFARVSEWYDYQCKFIADMDELPAQDEPVYTDAVRLSEVIVYERKELIAQTAVASLYSDRIEVTYGDERLSFPFDEVIGVSALGRKKINIYFGKQVYQLAGDERFCGLKYVNFYYKHKNILKGEKHGSFLGL